MAIWQSRISVDMYHQKIEMRGNRGKVKYCIMANGGGLYPSCYTVSHYKFRHRDLDRMPKQMQSAWRALGSW